MVSLASVNKFEVGPYRQIQQHDRRSWQWRPKKYRIGICKIPSLCFLCYLSVVVQSLVVGLHKDMRVSSQGSRNVDKAALHSGLAIRGASFEDEQFRAILSFHTEIQFGLTTYFANWPIGCPIYLTNPSSVCLMRIPLWSQQSSDVSVFQYSTFCRASTHKPTIETSGL